MARQNLPASATILTWLRNNKIPLGALTGHDTKALLAATQVAALWAHGDQPNQAKSAIAFRACVSQMQPHTQGIAYHVVAHSADWGHRRKLWRQAGFAFPQGNPECEQAPEHDELDRNAAADIGCDLPADDDRPLTSEPL